MSAPETAFRPPAPIPRSPIAALLASLLARDRDLLTLLPERAYRTGIERLGRSRRGIVLVNDPARVREVMVDRVDTFAKNDLFTGALAPLVGDGVFIAHGADWQRQRAMIEPGFEHLRAGRSFAPMRAATEAFVARLQDKAGAPVRLDAELSRLTADIIHRVIFSDPLDGSDAEALFADFARFQADVANVRVIQLILGRPFAPVEQPERARAAATAIRSRLSAIIEARRASGEEKGDLLGAALAARDGEGRQFSPSELVDQMAVFLLAGHETTASTLTWLFLILSQRPQLAADLRAEAERCIGEGPAEFGALRQLTGMRAAIQETLRLYPPGAFLPRVALHDTRLGGLALRRGTMVLISPWIIHRHRELWPAPDDFMPERFGPDAPRPAAGSYLPFGLGPRGCIGGAFAMAEAQLVAATVLRRFDIVIDRAAAVRPAVHLTLRPRDPVTVRFMPRRPPDSVRNGQ